MSKKLRLLVTDKCNRRCEGCCNKEWDLHNLLVCNPEDYGKFDEIILTGGEPMLYPDRVVRTIHDIRREGSAKVYVQTAKVDDVYETERVLYWSDGMTVTLHDQSDVEPFLAFDRIAEMWMKKNMSLRLNVFNGIHIRIPPHWDAKVGIEWIKDCPLPQDEVFMRLKG